MNAHRRVMTTLRRAGAAAVMLLLMLMSGVGAGAQEQTPATISVTVYACPPGMTADTLVAGDCTAVTTGFDIVVVSRTGLQAPLTIADASFDGASYVWSPGPAAAPQFTGANYGIRASALPDGYTDYDVLGDSVVDFDGTFVGLRITRDAPDAALAIYNFTEAGGDNNQEPPSSEPGFVTIYTYLCPVGYQGEQYAVACDIPLTGQRFHIENVDTGTQNNEATGAGGSLTFSLAGIAPGTVELSEIVNDSDSGAYYRDFAVSCTRASGNETLPVEPFATQRDPSGELFGVRFDAGAGDRISCDWFNVRGKPPTAATLVIHNRVCPVDYSGTDYYGDCHNTPATGQTFALHGAQNRQGGTGDDGSVTFEGLTAGDYEVAGGPPQDTIARTVVFCAPTTDLGSPFPFSQDNGEARFSLTLAASDAVTCDVYSIPADLRGETATSTPQPPVNLVETVVALPNTGAGFDGSDGMGLPWALVVALGFLAGAGAINALIYTGMALTRENAGPRRSPSYRGNSSH